MSVIKRVGVVGWPVKHSLSPVMMNAAFQHLRMPWRYERFAVPPEALARALSPRDAPRLVGLNLTIPHKEVALKYMDRLSPEARLIGAVNTVLFSGGKKIGHNTDGKGFVQALLKEAGMSLKGKRLLLLGAGGSARAIAFSLMRCGLSALWIANRTIQNAKRLVTDLGAVWPPSSPEIFASGLSGKLFQKISRRADILVNATSVGLRSQDGLPSTQIQFRRGQAAFDLVYNRPTKFLKKAREGGAKAINGLAMLLEQGVLSFEIWTKRKAPISVMRRALLKAAG